MIFVLRKRLGKQSPVAENELAVRTWLLRDLRHFGWVTVYGPLLPGSPKTKVGRAMLSPFSSRQLYRLYVIID
jgi:hypothetical protein